MSMENSAQLIQLILNSVLMVLACAFVLSGLLLRRTVLENRFQIASLEYFQSLNRSSEQPFDRSRLLQKQLRHFQQQVKTSQNGILTLYYALMLFVISTLGLSLRTVFDADWLVTLSMAFFVAGVAILLLSVMIVLLEFQRSEPFWREIGEWMTLGKPMLKRRSLKLRGSAMVRTARRVKTV